MEDICLILLCCVELHNMTVEISRPTFVFNDLHDVQEQEEEEVGRVRLFDRNDTGTNDNGEQAESDEMQSLRAASTFARLSNALHNKQMHDKLQADLTQHCFHVYKPSQKI